MRVVKEHWWQRTSEEIYGYRTTKPHAVFGWPVIGRHWGYVGRTSDGKARDAEHRYGGGRWDAEPQPWSDLNPKKYVIFRKKRRLELTTHLMERTMIRVLFPVYNISMNRTNPRRIKPWVADRQRAERDQFGRPGQVVVGVTKIAAYGAVVVAAWVAWGTFR